jgi:hypothetical protein
MKGLSLTYLNGLDAKTRKVEQLKEYIKCKNDGKYFIEHYLSVQAKSDRQPFVLFPHQVKTFDAYESFTNNITMKTRQMGFTTFTSAYIVWKILFNNYFKVVIISKGLNDSKEFLKMIKAMIADAKKNYPWMICDYVNPGGNKAETITLTNGSFIKAEAAAEDAGRGVPGLRMVVVDEAAFIDRKSKGKMSEIWSAVSPALASVQGQAIVISTPKGMAGWYYETYTQHKKKGFNIIDAHWMEHPYYRQGAYQYQENAQGVGKLVFLDDTWPEKIFDRDLGTYIMLDKANYPFVMDGKLRSPWYDIESTKLGPRLTRCELDCSFVGTGGEVFDPEIMRELQTCADNSTCTNPFEALKGIYTEYREYIPYVEGHKYVLSADTATGDGTDYSTFSVIDLTTLEIAATYKYQLIPATFANIIKKVAERYGYAVVVVENQNGGETTLQEVKRLGYKNIYYSTLQKKDPSTGVRKKKLGLWASEDVRFQGGDRLEEVIRLRQLKVPCKLLVEEFYTWIWDKDGKRRHAPEKHDDLIMAVQHGMWYYFYVYQRSQRNRNNFKDIFEMQRNGKTIRLADTPHGKGNIIPDRTTYVVAASDRTHVGGNLDNMIDARLLTQKELQNKMESRNYNNGGRRIFI